MRDAHTPTMDTNMIRAVEAAYALDPEEMYWQLRALREDHKKLGDIAPEFLNETHDEDI